MRNKIWTKEFDGKKYNLTQKGIFEGRSRKRDATKYAETMREMKGLGGEKCLARVEHRDKQSVVWRRYEKWTKVRFLMERNTTCHR